MIELGLDAAAFGADTSLTEILSFAAGLDLRAVELSPGVHGAPSAEATAGEWEGFRSRLGAHEFAASVLAGRVDLAGCPVDPLHPRQEQVVRQADALLHAAAALGAAVLRLSPAGGEDAEASLSSYADRLTVLYHLLSNLVPSAEGLGVRVGWSVGSTSPPLTPIEAAELIDRVNSPWAGIYVAADGLPAGATAADWIDTLGWRLAGVCWPVGTTGLWQVVVEALRQARFTGPVTLHCAGGQEAAGRATAAELRRFGANGPNDRSLP